MHSDQLLDWRLDPAISHSDFTIEVVYDTDDKETRSMLFHVHKLILLREREYFRKLINMPSTEKRAYNERPDIDPI
jgi:hypothetical protein